MNGNRQYLCIDLKSFYASVECVERKLDPITTNLVVADISRTEKTICLAVSPALKRYGIPGRARLFEVVQKVNEINAVRLQNIPSKEFAGESFALEEIDSNPNLKVSYVAARPRMALYMEYSTRIYNIYLKYISKDDIHVYSIDEVFMDVTDYLKVYEMTVEKLAETIINDIYTQTHITATAGIGTNMYLGKIAMDIEAKHAKPGENGVRMAKLDEMTYRQKLWRHRPLTDFWRVGRGYAKKLEKMGLMTMGDVARCSVENEELLYQLFGVNAELLIDHAWGYEPCTIADIKAYKPKQHGFGSGQVLTCPYTFEKAKLIVREMTELLVLDLVDKKQVTNQIVLTVGYDIDNLTDKTIRDKYKGEIILDRYDRQIPKAAHGTANLNSHTSSTKTIVDAMMKLYDRIVNPILLVRRVNISTGNVMGEEEAKTKQEYQQIDLFSYMEETNKKEFESEAVEREKKMQQAMLDIKKKYGKNAILKGMNLKEGAMTIERNKQIGGHKA